VSGAGAEEIYAPRLWYYNQRLFLCDPEAPHSSTSGMQEEEEDSEVNLLFFIVLHFTLTSSSYCMRTVYTKHIKSNGF
jgi:hypothetical protein